MNRRSADDIAGYQRWEPPMVGAAPARPEPEPPAPPTVADLESLERQAREEGYAAGQAEGRMAAQEELREQVARFDALCTAAARPLAALDDGTERELARLAMVVARQVIAHELALAPELIVQAVHQAIAALPAATRELRVRVHPDDLALLRQLGTDETHGQLLADPALSRGDCVLESERSRLDARVESRLAAVVDAVLGNDVDDGGDEVIG
jgi:flagellar assembly protein FliH